MPDRRPEPIPCSQEMDDIVVEDDDTYPMTRFAEAQEPASPSESSPEAPPAEEKDSQETAKNSTEIVPRQLRNLPRKDYRHLHSGKHSKKNLKQKQ
ncbi:hypothetical protein GE061_004118 [Apolygus lucorum]|uniref:Uncharacterized protein n=1 Tax=Apolygus lucorum TaxID=248454 RepID=A0A8S9WYG7_APOLU|nr:hypothetical protein GE061_004118 [Apolygus lucorum]